MTDHAIKAGYRHVDSATVYRNEEPSAKGMLKSGVPREQLYFTSKVPPSQLGYEGAKKSVDESLKKTASLAVGDKKEKQPKHATNSIIEEEIAEFKS